jgi:hypothetical protein
MIDNQLLSAVVDKLKVGSHLATIFVECAKVMLGFQPSYLGGKWLKRHGGDGYTA